MVGGEPAGRQCSLDSDRFFVANFCRDGCFDRDAVWCHAAGGTDVVCYATRGECDWPDGTSRGCRETKVDEMPEWQLKR